MHWQDNFPFEARRRRNSGSRSRCVGGWRPTTWPGGSVGPDACPCSAASARYVATCAPMAGRSATMGLDAIRGPQAGGVRRPPAVPPQARGGELVPRGRAVRPYAVVRRTSRRGEAVRGPVVPVWWDRGGVACAWCAR